MHPVLSGTIKTALQRSGFYSLYLPSVAFEGGAVLCYHGLREERPRGLPFEPLHVTASAFEAHCRLIRESCHPIGPDQLMAAISGHRPLPPRAVLVTFDDGYRSVLTMALPILERYAIPAVVFVCTDPIARGSLLWYDAVARRHGEPEVDRLKDQPFADWRRAAGEASAAFEPGDPAATLSIDDLRALAAAPGIEIGAHSVHHVIMASADLAEQRRQIGQSKQTIEEWIRRPVRFFSYPNGRPRVDYSLDTVALVRDAGFEAAFTTDSAYVTAESNRFELPRFMMLDSISAPALAHRFAFGWARQR